MKPFVDCTFPDIGGRFPAIYLTVDKIGQNMQNYFLLLDVPILHQGKRTAVSTIQKMDRINRIYRFESVYFESIDHPVDPVE